MLEWCIHELFDKLRQSRLDIRQLKSITFTSLAAKKRKTLGRIIRHRSDERHFGNLVTSCTERFVLEDAFTDRLEDI